MHPCMFVYAHACIMCVHVRTHACVYFTAMYFVRYVCGIYIGDGSHIITPKGLLIPTCPGTVRIRCCTSRHEKRIFC